MWSIFTPQLKAFESILPEGINSCNTNIEYFYHYISAYKYLNAIKKTWSAGTLYPQPPSPLLIE